MKRLSARHGTTVLSVPTEGKKEASEDNRNWDGRTEEREGTDFFERRSGGNGEKKGAVVTTSSNFYCQNVAEKESVREQRGGGEGVGGRRKLLSVKASQVFRARHSIVFPRPAAADPINRRRISG